MGPFKALGILPWQWPSLTELTNSEAPRPLLSGILAVPQPRALVLLREFDGVAVLPHLGARPTITRGLEAWHTSRKDAQGTYLLQTPPAHDDLYDLYQNQYAKSLSPLSPIWLHLKTDKSVVGYCRIKFLRGHEIYHLSPKQREGSCLRREKAGIALKNSTGVFQYGWLTHCS